MRHALGIAIVTSLGLAACGARAPSPAYVPAAPGSAVHFVRPPVIDGSRTACLAPPYVPSPELAALEGNVLVTHARGTRVWELKLPGTRDATAEESQALLLRLRALGGEHELLSYGLYCGGGTHLCFVWEGNLCETRIEERLAWFRALVANDAVLADVRLELAVTLVGHEGPRCAASDPSCAPIAYEGGTYDPEGERHAGPLATHAAGACGHDGDCMVMGCGNHCLSWEHGGAHEGATCEGYAFGEPVFCGCVEGACAWFTQ